MNKLIIHKWDKFWRLFILKELTQIKNRRYFSCKCECGNIKSIKLDNLRNWDTKSCGCLVIEKLKERSITHWMVWTRIYAIYMWIRARCYNPNAEYYQNYGGRWIRCEWATFEEFYKDMWIIYHSHNIKNNWDTSIERIDNNDNYCKSNCKWATRKVQCRNRRNNILYEWKCLKDWCNELWLRYWTIRARIKVSGRTIKNALEL